ncbi:MAG TPA: OmpH family outer membrane protein [Candidatus Angelobacter sp.]|jgi:outer membrane protein|nr:OmpH family outer membrane protein [Candidatus Angelobacter sp.]
MSRKPNIHVIALSLGLCIVSAVAVGQVAGTAAGSTSASSSSPASAGIKIGIVSIQDAIMATNEGKKELDAMQSRFGPRQNELKAQSDELEKLKADLQVKGDKLSEEERNNRLKAAGDKQKTFQRNGEDFQAEVQQAEQEVLSRLGKKMLDVMDKYAKDNNFAVILDVSNPQTPVLWASPTTNITKELVDAYNAASPVAAPSATRPAGTGAAPANRPAGTTTPRPPANNTTPKRPQ